MSDYGEKRKEEKTSVIRGNYVDTVPTTLVVCIRNWNEQTTGIDSCVIDSWRVCILCSILSSFMHVYLAPLTTRTALRRSCHGFYIQLILFEFLSISNSRLGPYLPFDISTQSSIILCSFCFTMVPFTITHAERKE